MSGAALVGFFLGSIFGLLVFAVINADKEGKQ